MVGWQRRKEPNIAKETLQILSKAGKYREIIELYNKLPSEVKELGLSLIHI